MAPEAFRGKPEKASDQYSLAVVLYELLCGSPPFSVGDLGYQHNYEPVPPLREKNPAIHPDVEAVIMKALAKQPGDRFTSAQTFAEAFEEALEQAFGSTLPSQSPQPDLRIPVRRTYNERHQDTRNTEQRIPFRPEPVGSFPSAFPIDEEEVGISELYQSFSGEEGEAESPRRFRHTGVSSIQSFFYDEDELVILQRIRDNDIDPSWDMFYPTEDQFLRHSIQYYMESRERGSLWVYAIMSVVFALLLLGILAGVLGSWILFGVGCVLV
jgi:serine/threonine protein kinase